MQHRFVWALAGLMLAACQSEPAYPPTVWTPWAEPFVPTLARPGRHAAGRTQQPDGRTRTAHPEPPRSREEFHARERENIQRAHLLHLAGEHQACHELLDATGIWDWSANWDTYLLATHCLLDRAAQEQRSVIGLLTHPVQVLEIETALRGRDWRDGVYQHLAMLEVRDLLRAARARWPWDEDWPRWARDEAQILVLLGDEQARLALIDEVLEHVRVDGPWAQRQERSYTDPRELPYVWDITQPPQPPRRRRRLRGHSGVEPTGPVILAPDQ